jgi:hypothetical protein
MEKKRRKQKKIRNDYKGRDPLGKSNTLGFKVPKNWKIEHVPADIPPEEFFNRFIKTRTPGNLLFLLHGLTKLVILEGIIKEGNVHEWSSFEHLRKRCGNLKIKVEKKVSGRFGTGSEKIDMEFRELIQKIEEGVESLYLTTQYEENLSKNPLESQFQEWCALPFLLGEYPLRPLILGNLVPQMVNLWIGSSRDGTSSGLHHDYHDNLYILLKGRKRFTLFSPNDAENLYINSTPSQIHPNGLINYDHPTRADGVGLKETAQYSLNIAKRNLQKLKEDPDTQPEQLTEAEDKLERAMEDILDGKRRMIPMIIVTSAR